ncbi:hypothetical protein PCE1_004850 [Barthelona sp. PCE]
MPRLCAVECKYPFRLEPHEGGMFYTLESTNFFASFQPFACISNPIDELDYSEDFAHLKPVFYSSMYRMRKREDVNAVIEWKFFSTKNDNLELEHSTSVGEIGFQTVFGVIRGKYLLYFQNGSLHHKRIDSPHHVVHEGFKELCYSNSMANLPHLLFKGSHVIVDVVDDIFVVTPVNYPPDLDSTNVKSISPIYGHSFLEDVLIMMDGTVCYVGFNEDNEPTLYVDPVHLTLDIVVESAVFSNNTMYIFSLVGACVKMSRNGFHCEVSNKQEGRKLQIGSKLVDFNGRYASSLSFRDCSPNTLWTITKFMYFESFFGIPMSLSFGHAVCILPWSNSVHIFTGDPQYDGSNQGPVLHRVHETSYVQLQGNFIQVVDFETGDVIRSDEYPSSSYRLVEGNEYGTVALRHTTASSCFGDSATKIIDVVMYDRVAILSRHKDCVIWVFGADQPVRSIEISSVVDNIAFIRHNPYHPSLFIVAYTNGLEWDAGLLVIDYDTMLTEFHRFEFGYYGAQSDIAVFLSKDYFMIYDEVFHYNGRVNLVNCNTPFIVDPLRKHFQSVALNSFFLLTVNVLDYELIYEKVYMDDREDHWECEKYRVNIQQFLAKADITHHHGLILKV